MNNKEYYRMPRRHEHDPIYSLRIFARFSGQFFFTFSKKKIVMAKKDRCAVFGCNNDRLFSREVYNEVLFLPQKSALKYWASAPWSYHNTPKSNKFNMAAVSVKWSIGGFILFVNCSFSIKLIWLLNPHSCMSLYSRTPVTRTLKGNEKQFELSR